MDVEDLEEQWRTIDARLARNEINSRETVDALGDAGLVRRAHAFDISTVQAPDGILWVVQPMLGALVPGPRLIFDLSGHYGGPRIYRPVRDLMLHDMGINSPRVPG